MKPRPLFLGNEERVTPAFFSTDIAEAKRFYLNLNPPKNRRLTVLCGGLEYCTANYAIHRHTFPFYSIEVVARGRGALKLKDRAYSLQPGSLFSYGPRIPHEIIGDGTNPLVKYFVDFAGTHAGALLRSCGLASGGYSEVFPTNTLQPIFDELIQAGLRGRHESAALCAKLLECLALRITSGRAPLQNSETHSFMTYDQCRQHIEKESLRLRTLKQIAGECHINSAYLCRLFRRYNNQSPYQYLLRLKMNHAAERLKHPNTLVKQVAEESGFADQFHFSRVFTSVFGISPTAFRGLR